MGNPVQFGISIYLLQRRSGNPTGQELSATRTILFRTRVYDGGTRVRKFGQLYPVFLAHEHLVVVTIADLENLNGLVALGGHEKLAGVIVVEAEDVPLRAAVLGVFAPEELRRVRMAATFTTR